MADSEPIEVYVRQSLALASYGASQVAMIAGAVRAIQNHYLVLA